MRKLIAALCFLASGCAFAPDAPIYAVEVSDQAAYTADLTACAGYAKGYRKGLSVSAIGESAVKGAASNAASAAVNALIPVLGAAGNASTELLNELDILNSKQRQVFVIRMRLKTERDRSALVLEPDA